MRGWSRTCDLPFALIADCCAPASTMAVLLSGSSFPLALGCAAIERRVSECAVCPGHPTSLRRSRLQLGCARWSATEMRACNDDGKVTLTMSRPQQASLMLIKNCAGPKPRPAPDVRHNQSKYTLCEHSHTPCSQTRCTRRKTVVRPEFGVSSWCTLNSGAASCSAAGTMLHPRRSAGATMYSWASACSGATPPCSKAAPGRSPGRLARAALTLADQTAAAALCWPWPARREVHSVSHCMP